MATPGRLIDFIWNTRLDLTQVRTAVLDEADEMLKMGFIEDVDFIMSCMIHQHQTLLFSATMPREIERLTKAYLKDPVKVELNRDQKAPQSLEHYFQHIGGKRLDVLLDFLNDDTVEQAIVFSNSRDKGQTLYQSLRKRVDSLEFIHGGLDQERRTSIFTRFKRKQIKVMVATDVAGRGLDFTHVSHVINYDFPLGLESYTHRTGRTGRMGRKGVALTFVGDRDLRNLKRLLQKNRIEPIWRGSAPDMDKAPKRSGGGGRGSRSGSGKGGRPRSGRGRRPRSGRGKPAAKASSA